jgi:hypothetical protein
MDPFLEAQGKWEDFHNKMMGDLERTLAQVLPPRYAVRLGERSYIDFIDPREERGEFLFKPDVGIKSIQAAEAANRGMTSVLEQAAVDMDALVEVEFREVFLEIHELDPQLRLVTGIEVLSPANKRTGTVGWYQYQRKRKVFLEGHANLVEMDFLRGGKRLAMTGDWPESPYYVMVVRKEKAPHCKVWGVHYREPLPEIPIPLAGPDADIPLALQTLVNGIYERSRYRREIDYHQPLRPPLPAADLAWLEERLRAVPT